MDSDGKLIDPITSTASISADARSNDSGNNPNDPTARTSTTSRKSVAVDVRNGQSASFVPQSTPADARHRPRPFKGRTAGNKQSAVFTLLAFNFSTAAFIQDEVPDPPFVCPEKLKCASAGWVRRSIPGSAFTFPSEMVI